MYTLAEFAHTHRAHSHCLGACQLVWMGTTHVGAARSEDGVYVVANYLPAGNMLGSFPQNVLPANSAIQTWSVT